MTSNPQLTSALQTVVEAFAPYKRPAHIDLCGFCYTQEELEDLNATPTDKLDGDIVRRLNWETADHWDSTDLYKHFLPLILGYIAPPGHNEVMYPAHLFDTLAWHKFPSWPAGERKAVQRYIEAFLEVLGELKDPDRKEWQTAWATLLKG
jgi:hypothetical protein